MCWLLPGKDWATREQQQQQQQQQLLLLAMTAGQSRLTHHRSVNCRLLAEQRTVLLGQLQQ
jgi:hypothetical protein